MITATTCDNKNKKLDEKNRFDREDKQKHCTLRKNENTINY